MIKQIKKIGRKIKIKRNLRLFEKESNCKLQYCVKIRGEKPGPTVLVSAATHGNEHVGVNFFKLFIKHLKKGDFKLKRGTVYFMLANPKAYAKDKRFIDYDLNRSFLKNKDLRFYEHKRAKEIEDFFSKRKIDFAVDLHSVSIGEFKMLVVHKEQFEDMRFAFKKTKLPTLFVYKDGDVPGIMISHFIKKHNALSLAIECGNHFSRKATEVAKHELYTLFSKLDILDKKSKDRKHNLTVYKTICFVKSGPNFKWLIESPATGTKLKAGQVFAKDEKNGEHKAPKDCVLVMPMPKPEAKDHDAGFLCDCEII